jgi:hypothetical protein
MRRDAYKGIHLHINYNPSTEYVDEETARATLQRYLIFPYMSFIIPINTSRWLNTITQYASIEMGVLFDMSHHVKLHMLWIAYLPQRHFDIYTEFSSILHLSMIPCEWNVSVSATLPLNFSAHAFSDESSVRHKSRTSTYVEMISDLLLYRIRVSVCANL